MKRVTKVTEVAEEKGYENELTQESSDSELHEQMSLNVSQFKFGPGNGWPDSIISLPF